MSLSQGTNFVGLLAYGTFLSFYLDPIVSFQFSGKVQADHPQFVVHTYFKDYDARLQKIVIAR
jgi:hypothetical protein